MGNIAKITTSEDKAQDQKTKARVKLTKQLIAADEFDKISSYLGELRQWVYINTVPSFFKEGFQLTGIEGVEPIEKRMRKAQTELAVLVNDLCAVFPSKIEESKLALGDQFNGGDYPTAEELRQMFAISWNWVAFTVPEGLPAELRQVEQEKLERQFADAGEQIMIALRAGFQELISHATERLTVSPGDKPKKIYDSMIGNIQEFIDTFNQRNLMNDVELAQLVAKAREVLVGVTPQKLRDYAQTKDKTQLAFAEIKGQLDKMITERPARQFDFGEEESTEAATA